MTCQWIISHISYKQLDFATSSKKVTGERGFPPLALSTSCPFPSLPLASTVTFGPKIPRHPAQGILAIALDCDLWLKAPRGDKTPLTQAYISSLLNPTVSKSTLPHDLLSLLTHSSQGLWVLWHVSYFLPELGLTSLLRLCGGVTLVICFETNQERRGRFQ